MRISTSPHRARNSARQPPPGQRRQLLELGKPRGRLRPQSLPAMSASPFRPSAIRNKGPAVAAQSDDQGVLRRYASRAIGAMRLTPIAPYQASGSTTAMHLAHADHGAQGVLDQLGRARGNAGQAQVDAELAAVAGLAGGMHAGGHGAELGDGLDQARQQARIGRGGDEKEGADGIGIGARRMGAAAATAWEGMGRVLTRDRKRKLSAVSRRPQAAGRVMPMANTM